MSEKQKPKNWLRRWYGRLVTISVFVMLLIFLINQIDQFVDYRREPVLIKTKKGVQCVRYKGALGCFTVFTGPSI